MPLSLRLAALVAAGSAGGLSLPHTVVAPAACLVAGAAAVCVGWPIVARRARSRRGRCSPSLWPARAGASCVAVAGDAAHPAAGAMVRSPDRRNSGGRGPPSRDGREGARPADPRRVDRPSSAPRSSWRFPHIDDRWGLAAVRGGLAVSVGGAQHRCAARSGAPGRTIVVPVAIRRPTRYRNRGLCRIRRAALAWRGTPLVGSAKSGLLVEVDGRARGGTNGPPTCGRR